MHDSDRSQVAVHDSDRSAVALKLIAAGRRFGPFVALEDTYLVIARGEALAVLGANGAGKTTLLRAAAGLLRPTSGTIELFGIALPGDAALRRRVGIVAHETFLYPDLTAAENLAFYAKLYGVSDSTRAAQLLAELGLADAAHRPVRTYSRGMAQRLSLARALLHGPEMLILDEPLAGLDPAGSALVEGMLRRARADGVTLLFTSHDFEGAARLATRAVLSERGRVAWDSQGTELSALSISQAFAAAGRVG